VSRLTFQPGPIVEERVACKKRAPLTLVGFLSIRAFIKDFKFPVILSSVKLTFPRGAWITLP